MDKINICASCRQKVDTLLVKCNMENCNSNAIFQVQNNRAYFQKYCRAHLYPLARRRAWNRSAYLNVKNDPVKWEKHKAEVRQYNKNKRNG